MQGPSRPVGWGREAPEGRGPGRAWEPREGEGHTSPLCLCLCVRPRAPDCLSFLMGYLT